MHSRHAETTALFSATNGALVSVASSNAILYQVDNQYIASSFTPLSIEPGERNLLLAGSFETRRSWLGPKDSTAAAALKATLEAGHFYDICADIRQTKRTQHKIVIWIEDHATRDPISEAGFG